MRNKNFLKEVNHRLKKVSPHKDTEQTVKISIKSDDKTFMKEILAEAQGH
jgi:hypothetical protein